MVDFNALLQNTLTVVNKAFETAQNDLAEIADEINLAVKANAGLEFAFVMYEARNDVDGVVFRFYFDTDTADEQADAITICFFNVPSTGYPVVRGDYSYKDKIFRTYTTYKNKEDVTAYFAGILDQPESPLIQAIGFALRKKRNEEIPF